MKAKYKIAEDMFNSGNYIEAFNKFENLTKSSTTSSEEISDAFNMMGVIVLFEPGVKNNDESGIEYFISSLDFNPKNTDTLLNIIAGFGVSINSHRNIEMLEYAIQTLKELNYSFSKEDIESIINREMLKQKLKNEGNLT